MPGGGDVPGEPSGDRPGPDGDDSGDSPPGEDEPSDSLPDEDAVVAAAVDAAEDVIFSRYGRSDVEDLDVTVRFEDGRLELDVYLNVPGAEDEDRVAEDAVLAARRAVDRLVEG